MPIYEYHCPDCAYTFELKQSMKDDAVAACEKCGKSVSRIISAPAIMFKGSGWYITDYSDKMKPPTGETTKPATTPADSAAAPSATASSTTPAAPPAPPASGGTTSSPPPSASSAPAATAVSDKK